MNHGIVVEVRQRDGWVPVEEMTTRAERLREGERLKQQMQNWKERIGLVLFSCVKIAEKSKHSSCTRSLHIIKMTMQRWRHSLT